MLNTSLHNHNVRDKPTAERFVSMNRGINEGGDLPEELLRVSRDIGGGGRWSLLSLAPCPGCPLGGPPPPPSAPIFFPQNLYESIKNEPFKIPEDDGNDLTHTFFNPDREGWLLKLGELLAFCFFATLQ